MTAKELLEAAQRVQRDVGVIPHEFVPAWAGLIEAKQSPRRHKNKCDNLISVIHKTGYYRLHYTAGYPELEPHTSGSGI